LLKLNCDAIIVKKGEVLLFMKTKILAILVTLSTLLTLIAVPAEANNPTVWDGSVASAFAVGDGTRDNPYLIRTAAELALFRDLVNNGKSDICAKQVIDIDVNNHDWVPIGMSGFSGVYDGGGWAIKNIRISQVAEVGAYTDPITGKSYKKGDILAGGLFGVIASGGHVRCVNVSGKVSINKSYSDAVYIGAIAGDNNGYIEECFSTCTFEDFSLSSNDYLGIGGIAALNKYLIINCFNTGSIDITVRQSKSGQNHYIGGIVGYDYGNAFDGGVYNCYNAAPMNINSNASKKYFGGVAGIERAVGGFSNNYYDKQVCSSMSAVTGQYKSGDETFNNQNPYGSGGLDTVWMHALDFPAALGNAYSYDTMQVNKGYPVLSVMLYNEQSNQSEWVEDEIGVTEADQEIYEKIYPAELLNKDLTKPITRVEFAAVAVKLYEEMGGKKLVASELWMPFADTNSDVIRKAYTLGIVNGVSDTEFDPYSKISRQDLATMLTRVYKCLYLDGWTIGTDNQYTLEYTADKVFADDADISEYAKPSVYFMVANGVIKGLTETTFGPRNTTSAQDAQNYANATREQAMVMAVRSFKNLSK